MSEIRGLESKATVKDGRRFESNANEQTIKTWVESVQPTTGIARTMVSESVESQTHTLNGTLASADNKGVIIQNIAVR